MATDSSYKFVVWERLNKMGKWCPYSPEVSQFLEQYYKKRLETAPLGDVDDNLKNYAVHIKDLIQVSSTTGTKSKVRRNLYDCHDTFCNGFTWQWHDDHDEWHIYDVDVNNFIEKAFHQGLKSVVLKKTFKGYHYEIDFKKMLQINKQTKRKRSIKRIQNSTPYPVAQCSEESDVIEDIIPTCPPANEMEVIDPFYSGLAKEVPGTAALEQQVNQYIESVKRTYENQCEYPVSNEDGTQYNTRLSSSDCPTAPNENPIFTSPATNYSSTAAMVNGHPWHGRWPPHTPESKLKPVPGIEPLVKCSKKPQKKKKKTQKKESKIESNSEDIFRDYTSIIDIDATSNSENTVCIICYESLSKGSSYDDDTTVLKLNSCSHMFHKSCLTAMYNNGPKDKYLQCPVCKKIYGEKCGIQPPGNMYYHVIPYSLPGYHECDTIRIIYDISSGTQGPEHPNPGKKYSARGFPRHCYLPDNEMGRKVLRLLVKAWKRRLIFTIGRSSTTGEEDTVTWNEIHHKTEFGCNKRGHGYPDPNYFSNILSELEAHGIKDDVYLWYPA